MGCLDPIDVEWCVRRLHPEIRELLEGNPKTAAVAGGFIRACIAGEEICDTDIFTDSKEKAKLLAHRLSDGVLRFGRKLIETENAYTVTKINAQFIHRWTYDDPRKICASFDFSVCAAAIWYDADKNRWDSDCHERFYRDLAAKRLVYLKPIRDEAPGGSLLRVLKYYQRGYRITIPALASVLTRFDAGIEKERGRYQGDPEGIILGLLREVDPAIPGFAAINDEVQQLAAV